MYVENNLINSYIVFYAFLCMHFFVRSLIHFYWKYRARSHYRFIWACLSWSRN